MRKVLLFMVLFVFTGWMANAQSSTSISTTDHNDLDHKGHNHKYCGTVEHNAALEAADPSITLRKQEFEKYIAKWIAANPDYQNNKAVVTIPIVFHIIYKTTAENISDTRINEQLNLLNRDFAGLSPHSMGAFSTTLKANTQIQFCLAQRKPDGTATTGIERKLTTVTSFSQSGDPMKKASSGGLDAWDVTKYFNVWVCNLGGGLLGYAQFPTSGINSTYGVALLYSCVGVTGASAPYNGGASATHEIGHCFNLFHIWGDDGTGCSGSDNVTDTPNQAGEHYNINPPGNGVLTDACATASPGTMYMNYMDYTDDVWMANFTPGQNARMSALFASGGALFSLTTSNGCTPPGGAQVATLTTTAASAITNTTATSGGSISTDGGATITARGVCWSTTANPVVTGSHTTDGTGTGAFSSSITGLTAGTLYHVRAYATNSVGTAYGNDITFTTTNTIALPTITTTTASAVGSNTATSGGNITNQGGATISARGVCWATTANPVATGNHTSDGTGTGTFTSNITGLLPSTLYHVRAYATNSGGTAYGSDKTFTTTAQTNFNVTGVILYNNLNETPMKSVSVKLMNGATQVGTTALTDVNGSFSITNIPNGTYTVSATTSSPWNGVTSTDVLKMKRHIAGLELLSEPIRLSAANVNASASITSTDVLKVNRRLSGLDASFACSDWFFEKQLAGGNTVTVNNANLSTSFYALCAADVNGSNTPALVFKVHSVDFDNTPIINVNSSEIFEIPVKVSNPTEIGAIQLIVNYPTDKVEIVGVNIPSQQDELMFNANNGELNIIWSSLKALTLNENDAMLTIKFKTLNQNVSGIISLDLKNGSELADAAGNIIPNARLISPTGQLFNTSLSVSSQFNETSVSVYPNPAQKIVFIDLGKNSTKDATVTIFNALGKKIALIEKSEVNSLMKYDFSDFANGLYIIQVVTPEGKVIKKVSINK